jgi:tRNA pseudouridine38-40 synthase
MCESVDKRVMRTLKLTLAYDGTAFHGWQFQPGRRTVQQTMQDVLAQITGQPVALAASGRTDAGVHALAQVASLETESTLPADVLQRALNAELPHDISVLAVEEAPAGFHARRNATGKRYRYVIHHGPLAEVFARNYAWHVFRPLDVAAMRRAAEPLAGTHDFASFQTSGSERSTTVRTIFELSVCETSQSSSAAPGRVQIEIAASGFLYNMVRNIVGTLVEVGRGVQGESWPGEVLAAFDRRAAGPTAPPQGLYLVKVDFV